MSERDEKDKTYQWPVEGSNVPRLGKMVKAPDAVSGELDQPVIYAGCFLMQHLYTNTFEWVDYRLPTEYVGGRGT